MTRLPFSIMLMDMFAGVLAIMMLVVAGLLAILIVVNMTRGDAAGNQPLMMAVLFFLAGGAGFYGLKRWAKGKR